MGKRIGVHKANVSAMERGKRTIGVEMAKRLGAALGVSYKIFL